jgi:hypothetical protein
MSWNCDVAARTVSRADYIAGCVIPFLKSGDIEHAAQVASRPALHKKRKSQLLRNSSLSFTPTFSECVKTLRTHRNREVVLTETRESMISV